MWTHSDLLGQPLRSDVWKSSVTVYCRCKDSAGQVNRPQGFLWNRLSGGLQTRHKYLKTSSHRHANQGKKETCERPEAVLDSRRQGGSEVMVIFPWVLPFQIFSISFELLLREGNKQILYLWELKGRKQGEGLCVFGQMLGFHESVFTDDTVIRLTKVTVVAKSGKPLRTSLTSQASVTTKNTCCGWLRVTELNRVARKDKQKGLWVTMTASTEELVCGRQKEGTASVTTSGRTLCPECIAFKSCAPSTKHSAARYLIWPLLWGCNRYH